MRTLLFLLFCGLAATSTAQTYLTVQNGGALVVGPSTTLRTETVRLLPGSTLKHNAATPSWLLLTADLRNRGTYSPGLGTVRLVGTATQRLDGPTGFYNLHLANPAGLWCAQRPA
jgi:hypothetical protein